MEAEMTSIPSACDTQSTEDGRRRTQTDADRRRQTQTEDGRRRTQTEDGHRRTQTDADSEMCTNSSSSSSSSPCSLPFLPLNLQCLFIRQSSFIFTGYAATLVLLLLPLCVFILWRNCCSSSSSSSSSSSGAARSHSDAFTLHLVVMELVGVFGCVLTCCGIFRRLERVLTASGLMFSFTWYGELFFHLLTTGERYLAVVHPVTYLGLRGGRGARARSLVIGGVWLLSAVGAALVQVRRLVFVVLCALSVFVFAVFFCSLATLCVLSRPGPGERGGGGAARERPDPSKQRAFCGMVTILGVLVVRLVGNLVWAVQYMHQGSESCVLLACVFWMNLPSAFVLPLLFLHRAGLLPAGRASSR